MTLRRDSRLPNGAQWRAHDRLNGRAAARRRQQLAQIRGRRDRETLGLDADGRYGPMTVDRVLALRELGVTLRAFHGDLDVTDRCIYADDTGAGTAILLAHHESGQPLFVAVAGVRIVATAHTTAADDHSPQAHAIRQAMENALRDSWVPAELPEPDLEPEPGDRPELAQ